MSEAGGGIFNENKESDETMKRPGLSNLQEALSSRLKNAGDSNVKISSEAYTTPYAKVPVKTESQRPEFDDTIPSRIAAAPIPKIQTVPSKEINKPSKIRHLFDDSSSESEGELFRSNVSKVPAAAAPLISNSFNPPETKLPPSTTPHLIVAKITIPQRLQRPRVTLYSDQATARTTFLVELFRQVNHLQNQSGRFRRIF